MIQTSIVVIDYTCMTPRLKKSIRKKRDSTKLKIARRRINLAVDLPSFARLRPQFLNEIGNFLILTDSSDHIV